MADITVTAANVLQGTGATINPYKKFGETVTAGQAVYLNTDDAWWKAKANGTAPQSGQPATGTGTIGIALNGGAAGQPAFVQTAGPVTMGGTVVVGQVYTVSPNAAGGVSPVSDLASTNYVSIFGVGISATQINLLPNISGIVKP